MVTSPAPSPPYDLGQIELPTPWPVGNVNAYLLFGEPLTLVDCGPRTEAALSALERGLMGYGYAVEDIELVLVTHQHPDHVGLAATIARRSGAEVGASAELANRLKNPDTDLDRDLAYLSALALRHGVTADELDDLVRQQRTLRGCFEAVDATLVLGPGDTIAAGSRRLRVKARPGHSPTDTVFVDEDWGVMLGGDHLLPAISSNPVAHAPPQPQDPVAAAHGDRPRPLIRYLESLAATRALPLTRVFPGHGQPFAGHAELIDARVRFHRRRAQALHDLVRERPASAADLIARLWPDLPARGRFLALSEVLGHVDLLERCRLAAEVVDDAGRVRIHTALECHARSA